MYFTYKLLTAYVCVYMVDPKFKINITLEMRIIGNVDNKNKISKSR